MKLPMVKWRRTLRSLHRDIGYFISSLLLVYGVSGIAVNHIDEWNPSYQITSRQVSLGPMTAKGLSELEAEVVSRLSIDATAIRGRFQPDRSHFVVFLEHGGEVRINLATGKGTWKEVAPRRGLFEFNALHLNHLKGAWSYVADAFAVLLICLALSGLLMLKGTTGLAGRGKWFVLAGLSVPISAIIYYYQTRT